MRSCFTPSNTGRANWSSERSPYGGLAMINLCGCDDNISDAKANMPNTTVLSPRSGAAVLAR
eukprot:scaffold23216_cov61-Phaeocystis_antarctica.AAC.1